MDFIKLTFFLALVGFVAALPKRWQGKLMDGNQEVSSGASTSDHFSGEYFVNRVDHFDRLNTATFKHRYFVNETFWKGADSGAPVFMCVGGEGPPFTAGVVMIGGSDHCDDMMVLAQQVGALAVALEHRYYGPSTPNGHWATENLRWHNTEQALEDIPAFVQHITDRYGLHPGSGEQKMLNKWVTWGGSYPGMMSAFARLRYPHLIHASVSSSSPIQASLEMPGYNQVVAESTANPDVGGSDECLKIVTDGHASIKDMLQTDEGRKELENTFNVCESGSLDDPANQEQFAGNGVIYIPAQGNDPACTTEICNIAGICSFLLDRPSEESNVDRLAALSKLQHAGQCVGVNAAAESKLWAIPKNPSRAWLWQTCTEWGFYQTCPDDPQYKCPYARGLHRVDTDLALCESAFGLSPEDVTSQVAATNGLYGGWNMQATRILFPNGEIDPWKALGMSHPPNSRCPIMLVKTASHHYWTHPAQETDNQYILDARQQIWDQVTAWLAEPSV